VFQAPTPPGGNKGSDEPKLSIKQHNVVNNMEDPSATELSRMFPTPPSLDQQHNEMSPTRTNGIDTIMAEPTPLDHVQHPRVEHPVLSPREDDPNKDWSFVFRPIKATPFVGSDKYQPIKLPSSKLQPLSAPTGADVLYRPSWHQYHQLPHIEKQPPQRLNAYNNLPSVENHGSVSSRHNHDRMTSVEASPATFPHSNQQRTPLSYELQSPASNASSYLNKNLNSVDNHGTNTQMPEVNSLVVNLMLSDSILNLFKDHNFDSCTICVCNNNIKGSDIGAYIPEEKHEDQYKCTCGFSAYTNRKFGANSGLFYEDEVDITGIRDERYERRKPSLLAIEHSKEGMSKDMNQGEDIPHEVFSLLQQTFSTMFPSSTVLHSYYKKKLTLQQQQHLVSILEIQDGHEACYSALEAGRQAMDNCNSIKLDDPMAKAQCLHKWPFVQAAAGKVPFNSQDVVRLLKSLQPLLQDTIQKKRTTSF
jgi:mediator of RNA polymerase II transcription subunit 13